MCALFPLANGNECAKRGQRQLNWCDWALPQIMAYVNETQWH